MVAQDGLDLRLRRYPKSSASAPTTGTPLARAAVTYIQKVAG